MLLQLIKKKSVFKINYSLKNLRKQFSPKKNFKSVIVGGTNGKGSVCLIMEKLLSIKGFKTGVYLSPHIFDYNERFRVNGRSVNKKTLKEIIDSKEFSNKNITEFELLTLAAIKLFNSEKVDWGIFEVGMGGKHDATRVIGHNAAVLTSVGFDHTEFLGNTLKKILTDKAHIFKNVPICAAGAVNGELPQKTFRLNKDFFIQAGDVFIENKKYYTPRFLGHSFQKINYALALFCLYKLNIKFSAEELKKLRNFYPENKFFLKRRGNFKIYISPSHNVQAVRETVHSLKGENIKKVLFFCFKDKDYRKMTALLKKEFKKVAYVFIPTPRALSVEKALKEGLWSADLKKSLNSVKENTLIIGSHSIVKEALLILKK